MDLYKYSIQVVEEHHIAAARLAARSMAANLGFNSIKTHQIMISVSELASNLVFHTGRGGTITLVPIRRKNRIGIEIMAEDHGPGIADIEKAIEDGFSTQRGLGSGLGGVKRLMDEFELCSSIGKGTKIIARNWMACR